MDEGLRGRGRYGWPGVRHRCAQSRIERLLGGSVLGHGGGGADTTRAVMAEVAAARQKFYQQGGFMQGADVMTWADSVPGQERHDGAEDAAQLLSERNRRDDLPLDDNWSRERVDGFYATYKQRFAEVYEERLTERRERWEAEQEEDEEDKEDEEEDEDEEDEEE